MTPIGESTGVFPRTLCFLKAAPNRYLIFYGGRLNFAYKIFYALGGTLSAAGSRRKLALKAFFAGGAIITLLCAALLYANDQAADKDDLNLIRGYEQSGDYSNALKIARDGYSRGKSRQYLEIIQCLEKKLLLTGPSKLLFNEKYQPRDKLLGLLRLAGMDFSAPGIIKINDWAQKNLLRQGERWQEQTDKFEKLAPRMAPLLADLGFTDGVSPHFNEYLGAVIHGALLPRIRLRLYDLAQQWKQGIRFTHLYFLSGERPLEERCENKEAFMKDEGSLLKISKDWQAPENLPKTECEMIRLVWQQSEIPRDMRERVKVHFINAPMKQDAKGKLVRPTTDDTVKKWLEESPLPLYGRYLVVTNNPYINRQDLVTRMTDRDGYGFDTMGSKASSQEKMAIFLDELARLIYQIKLRYDKEMISQKSS